MKKFKQKAETAKQLRQTIIPFRRGRYSIIIDCDDVLLCSTKYALATLRERGIKAEQEYNEITAYQDNFYETPRGQLFLDPEFVGSIPPEAGAQDFISELAKRGVEITALTTVPFECATARAEQIRVLFPEIKHILIGDTKELVAGNIIIDDFGHNLTKSRSDHKILYRRPWNDEISGLPAVTNFGELLNLIDDYLIKDGFAVRVSNGNIVCLIGPTGAGKSEIVHEMHNHGYITPLILTTSPYAALNLQTKGFASYYQQIDKEQFQTMQEDGLFAETTVFAKNRYGIRYDDLNDILTSLSENADVKGVIVPTDIAGANALRSQLGKDAVQYVYVTRPKDELIADICARDIPLDDKVARIMSIDAEADNACLCDIVATGSASEVCAQILDARKLAEDEDDE